MLAAAVGVAEPEVRHALGYERLELNGAAVHDAAVPQLARLIEGVAVVNGAYADVSDQSVRDKVQFLAVFIDSELIENFGAAVFHVGCADDLKAALASGLCRDPLLIDVTGKLGIGYLKLDYARGVAAYLIETGEDHHSAAAEVP